LQGRINREQMAWLEENVAALPAATPILLVTHIPLLTVF
jgi:3',5'-cyclic AMP phosphodiesterase CpdA